MKDQLKDKILEILRTDARAAEADIARRLGSGEREVASAIAELERTHTVLGYRAIVNPEKLEDEPTLGIIEVKITPQRNVGYDEIAEKVYKFPEVKLCYLVSGGFDLLIFIEGSNLKEVAMFVSRKLATIDNVTSTTTHFILKKYKEAGIIIGDEEKTDRLPIAP